MSYGGILIGLFWFYRGHCEYIGYIVSTGDYRLQRILRRLFWFYGGYCEYTGDTQRALLVLWGPL